MKTLEVRKPKVPEAVDPMFNRIFCSVLGGLCASHGRMVEEYGEKDGLHVCEVLQSELSDAVMVAWKLYQDMKDVRRFEEKLEG